MTQRDRLEGLRELLDDEAIIFDGLDDAVVGIGCKTYAERGWTPCEKIEQIAKESERGMP